MFELDASHLIAILPELFLALSGLVLLMYGAFKGNAGLQFMNWSVIMVCVTAILLIIGTDFDEGLVFNDLLIADYFGDMLKIILLCGLIVSVLLSMSYLQTEDGMRCFEYPILMLFAGLGMMIMVSSHNMLSVYMGLELMSLSLYVLAALQTKNPRSSEAGIKYFVLGAIASGMFLFGTSFIYGYTGSIDFQSINNAVIGFDSGMPTGFILGMVFVLIAIVFKISAAPFHMWTPDVYQGAPTSVTAFFALVPKIAAIGLLIRLLTLPFEAATAEWQQILWFVSAASMIVGAFAAIVQSSMKRLLAYSSIGHMGYALIGLTIGTSMGLEAVMVYLVIYMFMTAGVFSILLSLQKDDLYMTKIEDFAGLSTYKPFHAYAMAILMFSMAGIPPLAGFFGKLYIFQAAIDSGFVILAVLGVITSVVAAFYYLRVIKVMFFDDAPVEEAEILNDKPLKLITGISIAFVLLYIIKPSWLPDLAASMTAGL